MNDLEEFERATSGEGSYSAPARAVNTGQATQIEQARAIAEVRAMVMIAMENPRNEEAARKKMQRVCRMPALAERAFFRVPRGTKKDDNGNTIRGPDGKPIPEHVNGETIQLARELARCWGNIDYSVREMSRDDAKGQSEMMACAWDLEENVRPSTVFIVAHKLGKFKITSNQQIYENNAGHAGRRLREMIFNALPEWFKAEAIELCHETLRHGDGKPMAQRVSAAVEEFGKIGVSVEMVQRKIGRSVGELTPEDLATLRIMLRSIKRGEVTTEQEFPKEEDSSGVVEKSESKLDALEKVAAGSVGAASTEPTKGKVADSTGSFDDDALDAAGDPPPDAEKVKAIAAMEKIAACKTSDEVVAVGTTPAMKKLAATWRQDRPDLFKLVDEAAAAKMQALVAPSDRINIPSDKETGD